MTPSRSNIDRPRTRWAISIALAVAIHAVVITLAWPFVRPLMVRAFGPAIPWKPAAMATGDDSPIITGSISDAAPVVDEPSYAAATWDQTAYIPPEAAHLPFSGSTIRQFGTQQAITPPPPRPIAPAAGRPTIRQ